MNDLLIFVSDKKNRPKTLGYQRSDGFLSLCNQQVGGSSPSTSSNLAQQELNMGEFPSGQRGQTVNLLAVLSVVRIHLPPLNLERDII